MTLIHSSWMTKALIADGARRFGCRGMQSLKVLTRVLRRPAEIAVITELIPCK